MSSHLARGGDRRTRPCFPQRLVERVDGRLLSLHRIQQKVVAEDVSGLIGDISTRRAVVTNCYPCLLQTKLLDVASFQGPFKRRRDRVGIHIRPLQCAGDVCDDDFTVRPLA